MEEPIARPPCPDIFDEFLQDFVQDWTDTLAPEKASTALSQLKMDKDRINHYINTFE